MVRRAFFIVCGVSTAITALLYLAPLLLLYAVFIFFPVAIALGFIPIIAIYSAVSIPLVLCAMHRPLAINGMLASLLLPFAIAIGVPFWAKHIAAIETQSYTSGDRFDLAGRRHNSPRVVEIDEDVSTWARSDAAQTDFAPCKFLCQTLLIERLADRVRVQGFNRGRQAMSVDTITYRLVSTANCPPIFTEYVKPLPSVVNMVAAGTCVFPDRVDASRADLRFKRFEIQPARAHNDKDWPTLFEFKGAFRMEIFGRDEGDRESLVMRRTRVEIEALAMPLIVGPSVGLNPGARNGLFWLRTSSGTPEFTYNEGVLHWLTALRAGQVPQREWSEAPWRRYETPEQRLKERSEATLGKQDPDQTLRQLLDSSGSAPFGKEASDVLSLSTSKVWSRKELTSEQVDLYRRILRDHRFRDVGHLATLMWRHVPRIIDEMPAILDRFEPDMVVGSEHTRNNLGKLLRSFPIATVKPHAARIVRILSAEDNQQLDELFKLVGQLGVDTSGLIRSRFGSRRTSVAIVAACRADFPIIEALVPDLLQRARAQPDGSRYPDTQSLLPLIRLGRKAEAMDAFGMSGKDSMRLNSKFEKLEAGFDPNLCDTQHEVARIDDQTRATKKAREH